MEQQALNINYAKRQPCYRLRHEPVKLLCRALAGYRPDGDGYEEVWDETFGSERCRPQMRTMEEHKQRAARAVIPAATVHIVPLNSGAVRATGIVDPPVPVPVAMALLNGASEDELKIAELEAKIRELMGLVRPQGHR
jgi:hypothetical protein